MSEGVVRPLTYGRMGNFLFQVAAAMAYAWKHGMEYTLPGVTKSPKANPIYFSHLVNKKFNPRLPSVTLSEQTHAYRELPFKEEWRSGNIVLDGYWQTEKYFLEYRDKILDAFGFEWSSLPGFVSVHVRRGDYVRLQHKHPFISQAWLEKAMSQFPGYHFIFFSDDIPWCIQTFGHRKDVTFSCNKSEVEDLVYMTTCEHHVCSASTFSWWGAWLNRNPNKRIIIPKLWFTPGWGGLNTNDIVPASWTKL